eukprot:7636736-Pyramimonas_sp.AAC.1
MVRQRVLWLPGDCPCDVLRQGRDDGEEHEAKRADAIDADRSYVVGWRQTVVNLHVARAIAVCIFADKRTASSSPLDWARGRPGRPGARPWSSPNIAALSSRWGPPEEPAGATS